MRIIGLVVLALALGGCDEEGEWTTLAKAWCQRGGAPCEVEYMKENTGIVQPAQGDPFLLTCGEKLCTKASTLPASDTSSTYIHTTTSPSPARSAPAGRR